MSKSFVEFANQHIKVKVNLAHVVYSATYCTRDSTLLEITLVNGSVVCVGTEDSNFPNTPASKVVLSQEDLIDALWEWDNATDKSFSQSLG